MPVANDVLLSRQIGLFNELEIVSNNIANTGNGFRKHLLVNQVKEAKTSNHDSLAYANDIKSYIDLQNGPVEYTENTLDVAITNNGNAFFTVETPQGPRYTRNGDFSLDANYTLTLLSGNNSYPVLDKSGQHIVFQEDTHDIQVSNDGMIYANGEELLQLGVVSFDRPELLQASGDSLYNYPISPNQATAYKIVQGALEKTNVVQVKELTTLMNIQQTNTLVNETMNNQHSLSSKTVNTLINSAKQ